MRHIDQRPDREAVHMDLEPLVWPGRNQPIIAANGMVATSQPLAAQVGLRVLQDGGNAVDAAVAMAAAATVVEPATSSLGGDAFALIWDGGRLHALNGSGRAPAGISVDLMRRQGHDAVPEHGWPSVTVPGVPACWRDMHQRFGSLPLTRLLEPAAAYAEGGHPVSPISVWHWRWQVDEVHPQVSGEEVAGFLELFAPAGRAPRVGEIWRNVDMARSLRLIAATDAEAVYRGEIAERIVRFAATTGGWISRDDLEAHSSTWVDPIKTRYLGHDVWEAPPNGQGIAALIALNILEGFDLSSSPRSSERSIHLQVEAVKLGLTDARRYVTDPEREAVPTAELLSEEYTRRRRALIGEESLLPQPGDPTRGDTVYLCAADAAGMMVSYIQSSNDAFGSHVVVPGTGIVLQNRGATFSLDPAHPNVLEPGKRPFHTIIPGFLTKDDHAIGPFGVMGGPMQPQGHVQVIVNTLDHGMDPQTCLDQPRWFWHRERRVLVEPALEAEVVEGLGRRGHDVRVWNELDAYGRGQVIWRLPSGTYIGGSDQRGDGQAAGY
jgi:gamma-glutamyltranspeptidase / glutathione hydrolase